MNSRPFCASAAWSPAAGDDLIEYRAVCDAMIDAGVDRLDLDSTESGFPWYRMPRLAHQILNIRHIQEHAGQLAERLHLVGVDVDWVG